MVTFSLSWVRILLWLGNATGCWRRAQVPTMVNGKAIIEYSSGDGWVKI
jgi:hypothetical protein